MEGLLERRQISLGLAVALLAGIREEAERREIALAAAVVDGAASLVASQRMDGAALGAMQLAIGKAHTSVLWGMPSGEFMHSTQPGGDDWGWNATDPRIVVYPGGFPLLVDGELVGGVGASGAAAEVDAECVLAARQALGFDGAPAPG